MPAPPLQALLPMLVPLNNPQALNALQDIAPTVTPTKFEHELEWLQESSPMEALSSRTQATFPVQEFVPMSEDEEL
jgi:hypothetical protein